MSYDILDNLGCNIYVGFLDILCVGCNILEDNGQLRNVYRSFLYPVVCLSDYRWQFGFIEHNYN
jgi:hypothetical protein